MLALGCLIGTAIFGLIARANGSLFFLVLTIVMLVGYFVACSFCRCPHCGHGLARHHWFISYCPYCGGCL